MTTPLTYHDRPLTAEPINLPLVTIAARLADGEPVVALLEPGDATHYGLVLIPCGLPGIAPHLGRVGVSLRAATDWLLVAKLGEGHTFVRRGDRVTPYDLADLAANPWSQEFLAWWFTQLNMISAGVVARDLAHRTPEEEIDA